MCSASAVSIEYLMSLNPNITATDNSGYSILHHLMFNIDAEYLKIFLNSYSFELDYLTKVLSTFIYASPNAIVLAEHIMNLAKAITGYPKEKLLIAQFLTRVDENYSAFEKTVLHAAVEDRDFHLIQILLENGLDQTKLSNEGFSPFHLAALNPNLTLFDLFPMTEINHKTSTGQTALHLAVTVDNRMAVEQLLINGADIDATNEKGESPVFLAAKLGLDFLVKKLTYHGADLKLRNVLGQSIFRFLPNDISEEIIEASLKCAKLACLENETCQKLDDVFHCECKSGFSKEQGICEDLDECQIETCPENSICENSSGSFSCVCKLGYFKNLDGSCENFNECIKSPCNDENSFCVDDRVVEE